MSLVTVMISTFTAYAAEPFVVADGAAVVVATVVSVDEKTRIINLVGPEGDYSTITAGPEVRNFDQIKRGGPDYGIVLSWIRYWFRSRGKRR